MTAADRPVVKDSKQSYVLIATTMVVITLVLGAALHLRKQAAEQNTAMAYAIDQARRPLPLCSTCRKASLVHSLNV
ncbi:hypothetical protein CA267_008060 [Alteromonas pelagimontana]|uniref:Uncharacterized protein n=1 Tax=Alteromonas pelagimontana TaxID=1858656 RepID=A0A6M4MEY5_9ALTE|nr:hypothetical protein [Alteromonas pelagimontana]QJR80736.1 hypothetical protein CA267_008060 [Alteromonas pelagimontana]